MVVQIKLSHMDNLMDNKNGWFWYANNDKDMNNFISTFTSAYYLAEQSSNYAKPNNTVTRSSNQWDSLVQDRRNQLNDREGTLRDFTTGNNNTRLPNGSYGAGMRGFRRF